MKRRKMPLGKYSKREKIKKNFTKKEIITSIHKAIAKMKKGQEDAEKAVYDSLFYPNYLKRFIEDEEKDKRGYNEFEDYGEEETRITKKNDEQREINNNNYKKPRFSFKTKKIKNNKIKKRE